MPLASIAVPLSGGVAIAGGLSILLGYRAKLGAWLIVLFLIPVTLMLHKFWTVQDPMMAQIQMILFMKNVSMLGAALLISHFGAGPFSLDAVARAERAPLAQPPAALHIWSASVHLRSPNRVQPMVFPFWLAIAFSSIRKRLPASSMELVIIGLQFVRRQT